MTRAARAPATYLDELVLEAADEGLGRKTLAVEEESAEVAEAEGSKEEELGVTGAAAIVIGMLTFV